MNPRPARRESGSASPQSVLFACLVAVVAVGVTVAWLVLRGDGSIHPSVATRPPIEEVDPAPHSAEPVFTEEPPLPTPGPDDWGRRLEETKGRTFVRTDVRTGRKDTISMHPLVGRVTDDREGEPVRYFWLYLIPTDQGDPVVARNSWSPSHFRNGEFQIDQQPAGDYHLLVESREHETVTRTIHVPYDGRLEITLRHGSCIRGVVRDSFQTPLKDIEIHLGVDPTRIDGGAPPPMQRIVKTTDLGQYSFWKVPAGTYTLTVSLFGDELAHEREFRLDPGGEVLRDFTLDRLGTLKLTVKNVADQPVARARVLLVKERDGRERPVRTTYSDLRGVARLDFVREGSYKLRVQLQGFQTFEEPVAVAAGEGFRELPVRLEVAARHP